MTSRRHLMALAVVLGALGVPRESRAQADLQAWGNLTVDWIKSHRVTIGVKVEPKVLVSDPDDEPGWATVDVTPSVEYARGEWFDMVGEMLVGRTNQTDDLDSTEVTPRIGLRLHLVSNLRQAIVKERRPMRRLVIRDLLRLEWRNLYYSTDKPDSSTVRLRNRLESLWPLNRSRITDDGVTYLNADWEWFIPIRRSRRAIRQPPARASRPRLSAQLRVALRGDVRLEPFPQYR